MLKRVSIQNFKSLKDVTLDLQRVNLLIGPNNSGKSNFLKAIEFFSKINSSMHFLDLERLCYKQNPDFMKSTFDFDFLSNGFDVYRYTNLYSLKNNNRVNVSQKFDDWLIDETNKIEAPLDASNTYLREIFIGFVSTSIYKPDPSRLIHNARFSSLESKLNYDCSNIVSFFYYLDTNHKRKSADIIKKFLSLYVPEIHYFTLPPVRVNNEELLGIRFFDKDDIGYWASEVSEGVIYFLMILCIIYQPNPPKLLLLEEPEKGIHPRRIWEIMKFIFQLAEEKDIQIILTTHNEHVVNAFASIPEAVFVFDKDEEGATHVLNLQRDIIDVSNKKSKENGFDPIDFTSDLGKSWLYGLIGGVPEENI